MATRKVNGQTVTLTADEEQAHLDEWAASASTREAEVAQEQEDAKDIDMRSDKLFRAAVRYLAIEINALRAEHSLPLRSASDVRNGIRTQYEAL